MAGVATDVAAVAVVIIPPNKLVTHNAFAADLVRLFPTIEGESNVSAVVVLSSDSFIVLYSLLYSSLFSLW